ncbi:MAG: cytochrome P450 [Candidatus Rokubacteria bacterium]|nr:cytochrome P450 [Candidatus Rokubacteria bacterium]
MILGLRPVRFHSKAPPGPRGYPLVGVFPTARKDPLRFFLESARRYGDVVSMRFGVRRVYLLSHPDHVKHVLQDNHGAYCKSPPASRVRPLFGDSLTTVDGDRWRRQRQLMRPAFQPRRLTASVPIVTEATAAMLDRWQRIAERNEPLDLLSEMTDLTRAIILRVLFGDVAAAEARTVAQALGIALEYANRRLWSPLGWLDVLTRGNRRLRRALRALDAFLSGTIDQARREGASPGTLFSWLLEVRDADSGERMSDAELHDELKALLVAGQTTTASALAWVWYVLSENPGAGQELQRELRAVLDGRSPGAEDVSALQYTRMLIEEVLRLYPPTWVTARMPLDGDEIGGYRIAANAIVLLSPFVTHRHPGFWDDPDRFDPERFTPERSADRPRFAYFPFGGGPRSCIGSGFALVEMQLVVAMVAQRYHFTLVPGSRVDLDPGLTLRPRPGVPAILHRNAPSHRNVGDRVGGGR